MHTFCTQHPSTALPAAAALLPLQCTSKKSHPGHNLKLELGTEESTHPVSCYLQIFDLPSALPLTSRQASKATALASAPISYSKHAASYLRAASAVLILNCFFGLQQLQTNCKRYTRLISRQSVLRILEPASRCS